MYKLLHNQAIEKKTAPTSTAWDDFKACDTQDRAFSETMSSGIAAI